MTEGETVTATPPGRKERRLRLYLILSVALNLLVIGAIAGTLLTWKRHGGRYGGHRAEDFGLMAFSRSLPAERRGTIRKALRQERASLRPLWGEIGAARREAADVLAAEPYNRERLKEAIDRISEAEAKLKSAGLAMFLNTAEQLTPAERQELSEWWRRKAERMPKGGPGEKPRDLPGDTNK